MADRFKTWDRFDIVEGWYLALCHCHGGQSSPEYSRLSTMETRLKFRPAPNLDTGTLSENGLAIYLDACESLLGAPLDDESIAETLVEWETRHNETLAHEWESLNLPENWRPE